MIRTKASLAKPRKAESTFEIIRFEEGKTKLPKTRPPKSAGGDNSESEDSEFERVFGDGPSRKRSKKGKKEVTFQSARREIINYGIAGSSRADKIDLNKQLAIKLGAKPEKNIARNYKEILEEKRKQKEQDQKVNKRTIFGTSASLQYRSQKKKPNKKDGLLKRYGRVEQKDREPSSDSKKRKR